jgi:hypothetical protein
MPPAAMIQAIIAPNGPVATPKARGSEKIPAPTIEPTTIMVSANSEIFCVRADAIAPSISAEAIGVPLQS